MVIVDPQFTARTERLLIRPLTMEDAADINLMRSDPEVMKHTPMKACDDIEQSRAWIQGCFDRDNSWNFAIELLPTASGEAALGPRVIGMIGAVRTPEVGYMFNRSYWGKGYATEALRAFMPLFFAHYSGGENPRFDYAGALVDPDLITSQNVLEKVGFKLLERKEKDFDNPVLGLRDTLVYRLPRPAPVASQKP